jgi:glyoxylase I family protein
MKIEHFALNVEHPTAVAAWYGEHFATRVHRALDDAAQTHFLYDSQGSVMLEVYNNSQVTTLDFATMDPLLLHLAFVSEDPDADCKRLLDAGASLVERLALEDGSLLIMMRDPWGLAIQLCHRG